MHGELLVHVHFDLLVEAQTALFSADDGTYQKFPK